jgi:hypothetical protein
MPLFEKLREQKSLIATVRVCVVAAAEALPWVNEVSLIPSQVADLEDVFENDPKKIQSQVDALYAIKLKPDTVPPF